MKLAVTNSKEIVNSVRQWHTQQVILFFTALNEFSMEKCYYVLGVYSN